MKHTFLTFLVIFQTILVLGQSTEQFFNLNEPNKKELSKKILWATQYYVHQLNSGGNIPFMLSDGKSSNLFADTCSFCDAALEGTAFISDDSGNVFVLNFEKIGSKEFVDCRKCSKYANSKLSVENWGKVIWTKTTGFGIGANNYKLIPYRTIAVDKNVIPIGSVIYIPLIKGTKITLPNGEIVTHDGYFFAGDVGKAIIGNHIDIFTGILTINPFPNVIFSDKNKAFEAYIINDKKIISKLKLIHKK